MAHQLAATQQGMVDTINAQTDPSDAVAVHAAADFDLKVRTMFGELQANLAEAEARKRAIEATAQAASATASTTGATEDGPNDGSAEASATATTANLQRLQGTAAPNSQQQTWAAVAATPKPTAGTGAPHTPTKDKPNATARMLAGKFDFEALLDSSVYSVEYATASSPAGGQRVSGGVRIAKRTRTNSTDDAIDVDEEGDDL